MSSTEIRAMGPLSRLRGFRSSTDSRSANLEFSRAECLKFAEGFSM